MSKALRRASWIFGSITVSTSVLGSGYLAHAKGFAESEIKAMGMASQV